MEFSPDEIRQRYDQEAGSYDWKLNMLEAVTGLRSLRRSLLRKATGRVLAVGIGTGRDLPYYSRDCEITGVDLSRGMLRLAAERAIQLRLQPTLQQENAESLSFPDQSFDTVVSTLSVCTFTHPVTALQEMSRVCAPGGKVLLLEHGKSDIRVLAALQHFFGCRWMSRVGCHLDREPDALVEEAGLQILSNRRTLFGILHSIEAKPA